MSDQDIITGEVASRYASALYELASESKSLKTVEKDVKTLRGLFAKSDDLRRLISNPVFAIENKTAALLALAKKAKLGKLTTQFVGTVSENRRASDLPNVLAAFEDLAARMRGSQIAKVTSAKKLTAAQLTSLKSNLKKYLGQTVEIETSVDPDLLGGFVVRVGSRLYDSSLKSQIEDLRIALKEV